MKDEKEGNSLHFGWGKRTSDKSCAQHFGPDGIDGRIDMPKVMRWLRENGLEFVDIVVMSDNEAALTSLMGPRSTMK